MSSWSDFGDGGVSSGMYCQTQASDIQSYPYGEVVHVNTWNVKGNSFDFVMSPFSQIIATFTLNGFIIVECNSVQNGRVHNKLEVPIIAIPWGVFWCIPFCISSFNMDNYFLCGAVSERSVGKDQSCSGEKCFHDL